MSKDEYSVIKNAPTLDVHKWISVHDKLPEADCSVLVYATGKIDGFIGKTQIAITCMRDTNRFDCRKKTEPYWLAPWQYFLTDYEITHWQYLPEPPKEDDDGK